MQIFKCEYDLPKGKINHNVYADWDDKYRATFLLREKYVRCHLREKPSKPENWII